MLPFDSHTYPSLLMMVIKLTLLFQQENSFDLFLESLILEPDANHPIRDMGEEKQNKKKRERMIETTHLLMLFLHLFHEDVFLLILAPFILEPDANNPAEKWRAM